MINLPCKFNKILNMVGGDTFSKIHNGGMVMQKVFYSTQDISEILGICYSNALALIKHPNMKSIKINRSYYVAISNFNDFINNNSYIKL